MTDAPITARRAQTRARLMDAARTVFADRGVQAASVEEICETAGFTRGAFYSNFDSKDELCVALLENYRDSAYSAARHAIDELDLAGRSIDDMVQAAITTFMALNRPDREWLLVSSELRLYAVREPSIREAYLRLAHEGNALFASLMEPAVAAAGCTLSVPIDQALTLLQAAYEQTAMAALMVGEEISAPDVAKNLALALRAVIVPAPDAD